MAPWVGPGGRGLRRLCVIVAAGPRGSGGALWAVLAFSARRNQKRKTAKKTRRKFPTAPLQKNRIGRIVKVELGGKGQSEKGHKNEFHDLIELQNSPHCYPATEQGPSNRTKHFFETFSRIPGDTFCPRKLERAYCTSGPQNASDARDRNGLKRQKKLGRNWAKFR